MSNKTKELMGERSHSSKIKSKVIKRLTVKINLINDISFYQKHLRPFTVTTPLQKIHKIEAHIKRGSLILKKVLIRA